MTHLANAEMNLDRLNQDASPSSFVEEGAPDSFADIDAKLKALEEKTKAELAKLQSDTAAPSSLAQTDVPVNPLKESSELRCDAEFCQGTCGKFAYCLSSPDDGCNQIP